MMCENTVVHFLVILCNVLLQYKGWFERNVSYTVFLLNVVMGSFLFYPPDSETVQLN
jgi:hypothetical protein